VDLPVILASPPPPFGMRPGIEKQTVGVVAQFGDGMEIQRHYLINVLLLDKVATDAVIRVRAGQPIALVVELLLVEIYAGFFLAVVLLPVSFAGGSLRHGQRERAAPRDISYRQRRNFQSRFRSIRAAIEEVP